MNLSNIDTRTLTFLVGIACVGAILIFVVAPFVVRFTTAFEALSLLLNGLGEYFGNRRVVYLGCLVLFLAIAGCCVITFVLLGALVTCSTNNPVQFCRLIGR